ncbi:MAG: FecR domain-containing protein [Bacteroidales bacterium]|nr:FecR domain-containing protein [Bacteroidales bacterium]MDY6001964.1 FecR domain-containing protein [Candidatus Cryptobacteroides sp.]
MDLYLLIRYFACRTTPQEENLVRTWLLEDKDGSRANLFKEAHLMFEGMVLYTEDAKLLSARTQERAGLRPAWKRVGIAILRAAVVVAVAFGAAFWGKRATIDTLASNFETIRVPAGERMDIVLADSTHLWMNSGTEVELPVIFSRKNRNIKVNEGEVLLDVAKDERKPFYVETWAGKVKVIGTRFEVTADSDDNEFTATLIRGSIEVTSASDPSQSRILMPGEIARYENGSIVVNQIKDVSTVGCWSEGIIDVSSIPFDALMEKFEKAFNVKIEIERESLPVITYTRGKIRVTDGIEHALFVLQLASNFEYEYDIETATIYIR